MFASTVKMSDYIVLQKNTIQISKQSQKSGNVTAVCIFKPTLGLVWRTKKLVCAIKT